MKALPLSIFILVLSTRCFSQVEKDDMHNKSIAFSSSFGKSEVYQLVAFEGSPSYRSDKVFSFGLHYLNSINEWLTLETGFEYAVHSFELRPNLPPNIEEPAGIIELSLINLPLTFRANYWKYFFLNAGVLVNIDASGANNIDPQTGIGGLLGLGVNYEFGNGISIFLNPYLKAHTLLPLSVRTGHERLIEQGIRIGLGYRIDQK